MSDLSAAVCAQRRLQSHEVPLWELDVLRVSRLALPQRRPSVQSAHGRAAAGGDSRRGRRRTERRPSQRRRRELTFNLNSRQSGRYKMSVISQAHTFFFLTKSVSVLPHFSPTLFFCEWNKRSHSLPAEEALLMRGERRTDGRTEGFRRFSKTDGKVFTIGDGRQNGCIENVPLVENFFQLDISPLQTAILYSTKRQKIRLVVSQ